MPNIWQNGEVTEIECSTALEFLSILEPLTGVFAQTPTLPAYIFRGVSARDHTLLPAAYRATSRLRAGAKWLPAPLRTVGAQCEAEFNTLRGFFDIAARHGVRLPEDSQHLRAELDHWEGAFLGASASNPVRWPPSEFFSLIALAQHYGVPTRSLDWTWNPLIAAYFAARGAMGVADETISVWVFSYLAKRIDQILQFLYPGQRPLVLFTAPGADNENLRAQQGLFMLEVQEVIGHDQPFLPRTYDTLLRDSLPGAQPLHLITRVSLSSAQAASVIRFLSGAGVTGGSLFPGLWGVARELEEERLLSAIPSPVEISAVTRDLQEKMAEAFRDRGA